MILGAIASVMMVEIVIEIDIRKEIGIGIEKEIETEISPYLTMDLQKIQAKDAKMNHIVIGEQDYVMN